MAIYPTLIATSIKETSSKKVLKSDYQGGYTQTRPQFTRKLKTFTIGYSVLTVAEAETLENFIMDNQGLSFTFQHPITDEIHEVYYTQDDIDINYVSPLYRSTTVVLKEV
ncbi:hypothetical protein [Arcobacter arenosus]|uniref:Phage tail protein n=1 Tax=Arcobacter arenosus TaxID=2576037 RepID=A0A5R8Y4I5_9BACT|nr:hypothetical protein [Arcobacter arenosus]TLP41034.1 hypothetical protein FDK22_03170 [Arcobacter arenosus]